MHSIVLCSFFLAVTEILVVVQCNILSVCVLIVNQFFFGVFRAGYSCRLLSPAMKVILLNEDSPAVSLRFRWILVCLDMDVL